MFNKEQNSPLNVLSFSTRFGVGKKSMEEQVQEEVNYLNQVIQKKDGEPFDIQVKNACVKNKVLMFCLLFKLDIWTASKTLRLFFSQAHLSNAVSNNICSVVFGKRFHYNDECFTEIMRRLSRRWVCFLTHSGRLYRTPWHVNVNQACKRITKKYSYRSAVPKVRPAGQIRLAKGSNPVRELS